MELQREAKNIPNWGKLKKISVFHDFNLSQNVRSSSFTAFSFLIMELFQRLSQIHITFTDGLDLNFLHKLLYNKIVYSASFIVWIKNKDPALLIADDEK
jgi:hypothetical protein